MIQKCLPTYEKKKNKILELHDNTKNSRMVVQGGNNFNQNFNSLSLSQF